MCCQYTRSSQSIKIGSNQVIFIDWWRKSVEIDKRNKCVIDFYWLIDAVDINQIRFTDFYRFIDG